jgi:hypothetical protein
MRALQQEECSQEKRAQRYQPNEEFLEALRDLRRKTTELPAYLREHLEATFQQR